MNTADFSLDEGPMDGLGQADILPASDLRPDAEPFEMVEVINRQSKLLRAVQRMRGEGGVRVFFASEGLLIAGGPGNTGGENSGGLGGGTGGANTGIVNENTGGNADTGPTEDDTGPVDYDDLAEPYTPPIGSTVAFSLRQRSVTATLVGFNEFVASVPPRKYLTQTSAGVIAATVPTAGTSVPINLAAVQTWNIGTGSVVGSLPLAWRNCCAGAGSDGFFGPNWLNGGPASTYNTTQTSTSRNWTSTGDGGGNCCGNGASFVVISAPVSLTLSNEDTEEAAIGRASGTWGSWAALSVPAEVAQSAARTGFTFTATQAEVEVVVTGFTPSITYTVRAYLLRRNLASGIEEAWEIREYPMPVNSGGAGNLTFSVSAESSYAVAVGAIGFLT